MHLSNQIRPVTASISFQNSKHNRPLLLVHAGARNLQQTQTLPVHGATFPTKAESPTTRKHQGF